MAFIYTFLWGCAFPLVKMCMNTFEIAPNDNFSKMTVAGVRFFFSGIVTLLISLFVKDKSEKSASKKFNVDLILLYGISGTAVQYAFTYIGLSNTSGSVGALFDQ